MAKKTTMGRKTAKKKANRTKASPRRKAKTRTAESPGQVPAPVEQPPPAVSAKPDHPQLDAAEERRRRRRERREREEAERREAEKVKRESSVGTSATVASIDAARRKRDGDQPQDGGPPPDAKIVIEMPESLAWKIRALDAEAKRIEETIRAPIVSALNAQLRTQLDQAYGNHAELQRLRHECNSAVNAVCDLVEDELPDGFAVISYDAPKQQVVASHRPELRGRRLPTGTKD